MTTNICLTIMICPHCGERLTPDQIKSMGLRPRTTNPKSAENGKKGGRPKKINTEQKQ